MQDLRDFSLISMGELLHDDALRQSYMEYIQACLRTDEDVSLIQDKLDVFDGHDPAGGPQNIKGFIRLYQANAVRNRDIFVLIHHPTLKVLGEAGFDLNWDIHARTCYSGYDFIHPDCRRRGLGKVMMALRLGKACDEGIDEFELTCSRLNLGSYKRFKKLKNSGLGRLSSDESGKVVLSVDPVYEAQVYYEALNGDEFCVSPEWDIDRLLAHP